MAILITGKVPFQQEEEVVVAEPEPEGSLSIFSNTGEAVSEMMEALSKRTR